MGRFDLPEAGNAADTVSIYLIFVTLLAFLFRYVRLCGGIYANLACKAIPVPTSPTYIPSRDVSVLVPTVFKNPPELAECIGRISKCGPKEIFVILLESNVPACRAICAGFDHVTVLGVPKLGKRHQMLRALKEVTTPLLVFGDDDVFWPEHYLENLIAIFEDPLVGAGGTLQRVRRSNGSSWLPTSFWNILGIGYLERRVFNNLTSQLDWSCDEFFTYFTTDSWRGKLLNSDDDKCLTRYLYSHNWRIKIQPAVYLETTLEENVQYLLGQCPRWARARFRGNFTVMAKESYWYKVHLWGLYVIYLSQYQCSLLVDATLCWLLSLCLGSCSSETRSVCFAVFGLWLLFTKVVKMIPHFSRHPSDLVWVPVLILFGYFHSLLNMYCLCTLGETAWGGKDLTALSKKTEGAEVTTPLIPALTGDDQVSESPSS